MTARWALMGPLLDVNTKVAVQAVYDHLVDTHRLCRSDNLVLRALTPYVMLRLGKDQEAYDTVKWWAITAGEHSYDPEEPGGQYLNVRDADAYEDPRVFLKEVMGVDPLVIVALIKCRLMHDVLENFLSPGEPLCSSITKSRFQYVKRQGFELSAKLMQQGPPGS